MKEENIKAWVTKYALTTGIEMVDGVVNHQISSNILSYGRMSYAHGKDWHRTEEAAIARAEEMRQAKIASLQKNISKLDRLKFKIVEDFK